MFRNSAALPSCRRSICRLDKNESTEEVLLTSHGIYQFVLLGHSYGAVACNVGVDGGKLVLQELVLCCQENCVFLV